VIFTSVSFQFDLWRWSGATLGLKWGERVAASAGRSAYFFCSIGAPQHLSAPVPPLVTITCEPHFAQM
jgi:hypothetical protein